MTRDRTGFWPSHLVPERSALQLRGRSPLPTVVATVRPSSDVSNNFRNKLLFTKYVTRPNPYSAGRPGGAISVGQCFDLHPSPPSPASARDRASALTAPMRFSSSATASRPTTFRRLGQVPKDSEAAAYLIERGEEDRNNLNVFGSRRRNWEVMVHGLFINR